MLQANILFPAQPAMPALPATLRGPLSSSVGREQQPTVVATPRIQRVTKKMDIFIIIKQVCIHQAILTLRWCSIRACHKYIDKANFW
jgi:hypothetical protein